MADGKLPIEGHKEEVFRLLDSSQFLLVCGETGSGKTTQVPKWCVQYLLDRKPAHGFYKVVCTQPRRVAAVSVATRVAAEVGTKLGHQVGYSIRFEDCTSGGTLLFYVTDGMLVQRMMNHGGLVDCGIVVLDEAHERSIATDILMGKLKSIAEANSSFKVVIMSATFDTTSFQQYFNNCPILNVSGRPFEVRIFFRRPRRRPIEDPVTKLAEKAVDLHCKDRLNGDILIFVPGQEEVEAVCHEIARIMYPLARKEGPLTIIPLYAVLGMREQERIFEPRPPAGPNGKRGRKCIVATNIAETSLTIEGVSYVLDSGLHKQALYHPIERINSLVTTSISKASATQRMGRAGRTAEGQCFCLYSREEFHEMRDHAYPEMQTSNFANVFFLLKRLDVKNIVTFDYPSPPPVVAVCDALELLFELGAIGEDGELTPQGNRMAVFPLEPPLAKVLIASAEKYACSLEVVSLVALLASPQCFVYPAHMGEQSKEAHKQFRDQNGDHFVLINLMQEFMNCRASEADWCLRNFVNVRTMRQARKLRDQLIGIMRHLNLPIVSTPRDSPDYCERILKSVLEGYFHQVACKGIGKKIYIDKYEDRKVSLHNKSSVKGGPAWVVYHEFFRTDFDAIIVVSALDPRWFFEVVPQHFDWARMLPSFFRSQMMIARSEFVAAQLAKIRTVGREDEPVAGPSSRFP